MSFFRPEAKSPRSAAKPRSILQPRAKSVSAVMRIQARVAGSEADFHDDSYPRTLSTSNRRGLLNTRTLSQSGSIAKHARKLVDQRDIVEAFDLHKVELRLDSVNKQNDGSYRVDFKQVLSVDAGGSKRSFRVRKGNVQVYLSKHGRIDQITSTVKHAEPPQSLATLIGEAAAVAAAMKDHGAVALCKCVELSFSLHEGKFNPVYDVVLDSRKPKKVYTYIVDAVSGKVVHAESKLHIFRPGSVQGINVSTLLNVPDNDKPISEQAHDMVMKWVDPKNPRILGNDRYKVVIGANDEPVEANAQGNFKFAPGTSQFRAVANFFAVMFETELLESSGAKVAEQYLLSVDNPDVTDNAYCDYINRTIKIGVGSGLESGGLNKNLSYDIGVVQHEAGHKFAGDEVPGGDLGGTNGAAINEGSCGDGSYLVSNFLMRLLFAKELGHELTKDEIKNDGLVIGSYAIPKTGIRTQKNDKQAGKDEEGEEHADGLICGSATAELLQALATDPKTSIESGLRLYARIYIEALHRMPKGGSTFADLLRAFINADQKLSKGANRKSIEKCFARHSIKV